MKIYKYTLAPFEHKTLTLPSHAHVVSAIEQNNTIAVYVQMNEAQSYGRTKDVTIIALPTGDTTHILRERGLRLGRLVATVPMHHAEFVFHVFEAGHDG